MVRVSKVCWTCSVCKLWKPTNEFYGAKEDCKPSSHCKQCYNERYVKNAPKKPRAPQKPKGFIALSEHVREDIIKMIKAKQPVRVIAEKHGLNANTLGGWKAKGWVKN